MLYSEWSMDFIPQLLLREELRLIAAFTDNDIVLLAITCCREKYML